MIIHQAPLVGEKFILSCTSAFYGVWFEFDPCSDVLGVSMVLDLKNSI